MAKRNDGIDLQIDFIDFQQVFDRLARDERDKRWDINVNAKEVKRNDLNDIKRVKNKSCQTRRD